MSGFALAADAYNQQEHTWIVTSLIQPTYAVRFFGPGAEFLTFFDNEGEFLVEAIVSGNVSDWFIGIVSETPIGSAIVDLGGTHAQIQAMVVGVIPEPSTLLFLILGSVAMARRRLNCNLSLLAVAMLSVFIAAQEADAGPVTFINDYQGFLAAAGDVRVIDFETLPDGTPTIGSEHITPEFNYGTQGVTFSPSVGNLVIGGNSVSGFELIADAYDLQQPAAIIAELEPAASAVGVFFVGGMYLDAYNAEGDLIMATHFGQGGGPWFLGIVSDEPIFQTIADKRDFANFATVMLDFVYSPIPEPSTIGLLIFGSIAVVRKRLNK